MTSPFHPDVVSRLTPQVRNTITAPEMLEDPVGRQYVRDPRETDISPSEREDPIGDAAHTPVKGVVHRYPDRVLLKITDICSIYCRFCFRKEMIGLNDGVLSEEELSRALEYIAARPEIREVILTGGDPLTLSNRRLENVFSRLEDIPHIDILRIHTRTPIVRPERIDAELAALFASLEKALFVVLHVNHAQEVDQNVEMALTSLHQSGAVLLSQSVLLKGVNDDPEVLATLFRKLLKNRVKPYYLHHLDLAPGTGHFRVSIQEGQQIMRALRGRVTGLAYPTYVLDLPGGYGKMPLTPCQAREMADGTYMIEDYKGALHAYPPICTAT